MGNDMCIYVILDALDTGYVIVIHWICDFTVATRNTREKDTLFDDGHSDPQAFFCRHSL